MNSPDEPFGTRRPPRGPLPDAAGREAQGLSGFQDPLATPPGDPAADSVEQRIRNPHAPLCSLSTSSDPLLDAQEQGIEYPTQVPPKRGSVPVDALPQMMDLLERSVESAPTGPPTAEDAVADRQAELLDLLERSIEDAPPLPPETDGTGGSAPPGEEAGPGAEGSAPREPHQVRYVSQDCESPDVDKDVAGQATRCSHGRQPAFFTRKTGRPTGGSRTGPRRETNSRLRRPRRIRNATPYCPETRDVADIRECTMCEKYRHWPDGSDEEPRTCWYRRDEAQMPREDSEDHEEPDD